MSVGGIGHALPPFADTVVIGAGTAGAAVAGLLAERGNQSVLLLEAGPDYGPYDAARWPAELLDARALPVSHDWGYDSAETWPHRRLAFERARVVGGCSAHNGCAEIWGSRLDYDGWVELGNPGWSADELLPLFEAGAARLRVRRTPTAEVTPFQLACLQAAPRIGLPVVTDLNDLDEDIGIGLSPVNIVDGVRWNAAFAYLDAVRGRGHLTICGDTLVDRLLIRGGRVDGVAVIRDGAPRAVRCGRVVLCGGAFGSPAVLLRSGVGDPSALSALGIATVVERRGVGRNLHDHPATGLIFSGTPELERRMRAFGAAHWTPEEQAIAKARSSQCRRGFDLHLFPTGGPSPDGDGWRWMFPIAAMTPRSRGTVQLASAAAAVAPRIDHGFLTDPAGEDLRVLVDGIELGRALAAAAPLSGLLGDEMLPGASAADTAALGSLCRDWIQHYYHPVGTCRMGPAADADAVCDARGRVHGLDNAWVADAALIPVIPRANTNMPVLVVAQRIVQWLTTDGC
ncbi:MAG: GMC family oxidoreductase [bacterium]